MKTYFLKNKPGERMAIIVDEKSPEIGTLVLFDRREDKGPFVVIGNNKLPIIRLEQPPELCGIDDGVEDIMPYTKQFCISLQKAINESGIKFLGIVDGADGLNWKQSPYSSIKNIKIRDVKENVLF